MGLFGCYLVGFFGCRRRVAAATSAPLCAKKFPMGIVSRENWTAAKGWLAVARGSKKIE
jgi:hypothetical protein